MAKHRKIVIIGKQRPALDAGLMAQLIIVLGKQMWEERQRPKRRSKPDAGHSSSDVAPEDA